MHFLLLLIFIAASFHTALPRQPESLIPRLIQEWKNAIHILNERNMEFHFNGHVNSGEETDIAESDIAETAREMECLVKLLITKYENSSSLIVPLNHLNFDVLNNFIKLKGSLEDTKVYHLGNYKVNQLNFTVHNTSIIKCSFGIHFNKIQLEGVYDLDLNILTLVPIYGQGDFGLSLENFTMEFEIDMSLNLTKNQQIIYLEVTSLNYGISQISMDLSGFIEEGDYSVFLNKVLTDVTATLLMQNKKLILSLLKPLGTNLLTSKVKDLNTNTQQIIDLLKHIITIAGITDTCTKK